MQLAIMAVRGNMEEDTLSLPKKSPLSSFLKDLALQLHLGIYSIPILVFVAIIIFSFIYFSLNSFSDIVLSTIQASQNVEAVFLEYLADTQLWIVSAVMCFFLSNIILSCVYFHRLIRPNQIFRRHVRRLIDGDYNSLISLEKRDGFGDLANDLNRLAVVLRQRQKNK